MDRRRTELASLEASLTDPAVWGAPERVKVLQKQRAELRATIDDADSLATALEECETLLELLREGEPAHAELERAVGELERRAADVELATLLTSEHDPSDAIVEIHPGAGGTEAQDWAEMLLRMYTRWAERSGFSVDTLDYQPGEEAGVKSVTLAVRGRHAYGYLKCERGVHRLVRISPFDAQHRRHTSFASLDVIPEIEGELDVPIEDKDLRIDTYRASGAGGQHVNKTESAVRITHLPSGIVVTCQNERSQHRNREMALHILRAKLFAEAERRAEERLAAEQGQKKKIEWGSQIRSYTLAPFRLVKDHRTGHEVGNADRVLDGDLQDFIRAALVARRETAGA